MSIKPTPSFAAIGEVKPSAGGRDRKCGEVPIRRLLRRAALPVGGLVGCLQFAMLPGASEAADTFTTADELRGQVTFRLRGEEYAMRVKNARLETVVAALASRGQMQVDFFCTDPAHSDARLSLRSAAPNYERLLTDALGEDLTATFAADTTGDGPLRAKVRPGSGSCDVAGTPVRTYFPGGADPRLETLATGKADAEVFRAVMREAGPESRRNAVLRLRVRDGQDPSIELLLESLDDPDADTAVVASRLLGRAGRRVRDKGRLDEIARRFVATAERRRLLDMVVSVGNYGGEFAWPLVEAIIGSGHEQAESFAVRALVTSADERGIPWLLGVVRNTAENEQARQAMWAIARTQGVPAAKALTELLGDDALSIERRAFVAQGLETLAPGEEAQAARALLQSVLRSPDTSVRDVEVVAEALCTSTYPEPLAALLASTDISDEKKAAAITVIGARGGPAMIPSLAAGTDDASDDIRLRITRALQQVAHPDSQDTLLKLAKDRSADVRAAAIYGLTRLASDTPVTQQLVASLDDPAAHVRLAAIQTLARIQTMTIVAQKGLEGALEHKDPIVAELALDTLEAWSLR